MAVGEKSEEYNVVPGHREESGRVVLPTPHPNLGQ